MKKLLLFLALTISTVVIVHAWPRLGRGVSPTFENSGNKSIGFTVAIGTTTKVKLYAPSYSSLVPSDERDRLITVQQISAYNLYCSTSSTGWTASSGPRWVIFSSTTYTTTNVSDTWCLFEVGAGAGTKEVIGRIDYDSRD